MKGKHDSFFEKPVTKITKTQTKHQNKRRRLFHVIKTNCVDWIVFSLSIPMLLIAIISESLIQILMSDRV